MAAVVAASTSPCFLGSGRSIIGASFDPLKQLRAHKCTTRTVSSLPFVCSPRCSRSGPEDDSPSPSSSESKELSVWSKDRISKAAIAAFAAGLIILSPGGSALAAKSGGRVGGQAFRSAPPPRAAPRFDGPRRTNIFINPPPLVAPPLYGGYGGWGLSPFSYFFPGPSVAVGVNGGFFSFFLFLAFVSTVISLFRRGGDDDYDD